MKLPVLDAASRACLSCHGPCCLEHAVPITGFDLWRLSSGLQVPWASLVELEASGIALGEAFRLDRSGVHFQFVLKRKPSGACALLVEIDDTHRRCGVHALRPGVCRRYPLAQSPDGAELAAHAICPAPQAAMYRAAAAELRAHVDEPEQDRALYVAALARWDLLARFVPVERPVTVDQFLAWLGDVYLLVDRLRGAPDWLARAEALVDEFPLPEIALA